MNPRLIKYFLATLGIIVAVLAIVFGSIQPLSRSQRFISALRNVSNVKTLDEFKQNFDAAFNMSSPVGDEELAKFLSDQILNLISQENQPEDVSRALVAYLEPHMLQNNVRHLLAIGNMHVELLRRFRKQIDFNQAESAYLRAMAIGPKLPPVLYTLADLYIAVGNRDKFTEIANTILSYWPDDAKLKSILEVANSPVSVTPATSK